jgi:2',3'-cyclic-nucleotide 2'-phosphodiesterase (5'-nucleotidase family)
LALSLAAPALGSPARGTARAGGGSDGPGDPFAVQLLTFNDFHGQLRPPEGRDATLGTTVDPSNTTVGGSEYLATTLNQLRAQATHSITAVAGDAIGASPFLSAAFRNEPTIEALNAMGLDVAAVGNHEFDAGISELLRMDRGGCSKVDGCYFPGQRFKGANFPYLAANVYKKTGTKLAKSPVLPATHIEKRGGVKIGFIGMTLSATPNLVDQRGIKGYVFLDEVVAAQKAAKKLAKAGVKAIVLLVHEGGLQKGNKDQCAGASGPILDIAARVDPRIDVIVSGHTHQSYVCNVPDPAGNPRLVTSASSLGRLVTDTTIMVDPVSEDVIRDQVAAHNELVVRTTKDPAQTAIINRWTPLEGAKGDTKTGMIGSDITRSASRDAESALANFVADSQLHTTAPTGQGGAQIAFMNPGGVRADLTYAPSTMSTGQPESVPGLVRYSEAFAVEPFGNNLVTMGYTGAEIQQILEEQFIPNRAGAAPKLILGVSKGFEFNWVESNPAGSKVPDDSVKLNGVPLDQNKIYRVVANAFLAGGGDGFATFTKGRDPVGGGVDIDALVGYFATAPVMTSPGVDRIHES